VPLPQNGQLAWGTPLNSDILNDEANIGNLQQSLSGHEANNPPDPHGDRAYTSALVTPITTGLNMPPTPTTLGLVQLGVNGKIPLGLVPTGAGLYTFIDAVPDFNVPVNGAPAAGALNQALAAANAQGGGIVWVGSGVFGIDQPLLISQNTWLMCSPGAVFNRIQTVGPPVALVQNYSQLSAPVGGNIRISGGYWNVNNCAGTAVAFSFAHTTMVLIEDLIVVAYPDGLSPVAELFGCSNVTIDNVAVYGPVPLHPARVQQARPCFRVEECNVVNLPNNRCPNSVLDGSACSNVTVRACSLSPTGGAWPTDSFGPYSAWSSFCGTTGTVTNGNRHNNINIVDGCFSAGLAACGIQVNNWNNVTATGCDFSYPQTPYLLLQDGVAGVVPLQFLYDINSPKEFSPAVTNITVINISETIVNQFAIPANDWIPGATCYEHHHGGYITCPQGATLTFKIYVGNSGGLGDTLTETITITMTQAHVNDPYTLHHRGFDCDSDGGWNHCGTEFFAPGEHVTHCGNVRPHPTQGSPCYVSHSCSWDSGAGRSCQSKHGTHNRRKQ
jgi:hypothetical protein